ncbi:Meiotic nuclear division protein 1 [Dinochytrium kinnereticum]|nr:Meiotic nuclear division protein 1 [Dinochytrium kinnereticum]
MSRKKALSQDEKKKRMMDLFAETMDFWTLKELEKMAPKSKGIVGNTVKEILDMLVDSRTDLQRQLAELEELNRTCKKELSHFKDCDPVLLKAKGMSQIE